ncbi:hypothetical protein LTR53_014739, partial [Teratosphaeriaceae sp. CCFEE 6253]
LTDAHKAELDRVRLSLETNIREVASELESANSENVKLKDTAREEHAAHAKELELAGSRQESEAAALRKQIEEIRTAATQARDKSQGKLADLAGRLAAEAKDSKVLREQLQRAEQSHRERVKDMEADMADMEQRLESAEKAAADAAASTSARESDLIAQASTKGEELTNTLHNLSKLREETDATIGRLSEEISAHERDLAKTIQDHKTQHQQLEDQHSEDTEHLNAEHSTALAAGQKDMSGLQTAKDAELAKLQKKLENVTEAVDAAQLRHNENVNAHASVLQEVHTKHSRELEELQARHVTEVERRQADMRATVEKAADDQSGVLRELRKQHEETSDGVRRDCESKLEQLKDEHSREIGHLLSQHEEAIKTTGDHHAQAMNELRAEHGNAIQSAKQENEAHAEQTRDEHAQRTDRLLANHGIAQRDWQEVHEAAMVRLKEQHTATLDASQREADDHIHRLDKDHARESAGLAVKQQAEADRRRAEDQEHHQRQIERLQTELQTSSQEHQAAFDTAASDHAIAVTVLRAAHDQDRTTVTSHAEKTLDEMRSAHGAALEALRRDHVALLGANLKKHEDETSSLHMNFEIMSTQHKDQLSALAKELTEVRDAANTAQSHFGDELARERSEHATAILNAEAGWSSKADEAARAHQADLQSSVAEASGEAAAKAHEHLEKQLAERDVAAETRLATVRESTAAELADARQAHAAELETAQQSLKARQAELRAAQSKHDGELEQMQATMSEQLAQTKIKYNTECQRLERASLGDRQCMEQAQSDAANELSAARESHIASARALEARLKGAESRFKADISERDVQLARIRDDSRAGKEAKLADLHRSHQSAMDALRQRLEAQLIATHYAHQKDLEQLQDSMASHSRSSRDLHEQALWERDAAWTAKMAALKEEQAKSFTDILQSSDASTAEKMEELKQQQSETLKRAVEDARTEAVQTASHAQDGHQTALDRALSDAGVTSDAAMAILRSGHEEELARVREAGEKENQALISKLESEHQAALATALSNAALDHESKSKAQVDGHGMDIERMRGNLTAELTVLRSEVGQAAEVREEETRKTGEEREQSRAELADHLQKAEEKASDVLAKQEYMSAEIAGLQARLDAENAGRTQAEQSLAETRRLHEDDSTLSAEAGADAQRQLVVLHGEHNDLRKEHDQAISTLRELQGISTKTDSREPPPSQLSEEVIALKQRLSLAEQERSEAQAFVQQKLDEKAELAEQNESLGERTGKTRSFEDYLQQAQAELSELGSVITANEALFALKIQEHVGDLQRAKDDLAAEYKEKFDDLLTDKTMQEKDAMSRGVEDFTKDRNRLLADNGIEDNEPSAQNALLTSLPLKQAKALRTAEERLVSEYNRRIAKRKSQIALKHAEDFQSLTQQYDHHIAELLSDKEKLEGDLSVEPERFEQDLDEFEVKSVQLEAEKARSFQDSPDSRRDVQDLALSSTIAITIASTRAIILTRARTRTCIPNRESTFSAAPTSAHKHAPHAVFDTQAAVLPRQQRQLGRDFATARATNNYD